MEPTVGRMVIFVLSTGPNRGQNRPAVITNVYTVPGVGQRVNLQVFADGDGDGFAGVAPVISVPHNHDPIPGTWHERASS